MNFKETRLENGLTIVTDRMDHLRSVALGVWVNSGSRDEHNEEHGLAHLLEHMAFKGTNTRSAVDIAEEIEAVGGELNAATSVENTAYYARVLSADVELAVDILADILQNSTFDPEELAKEQHVILQEIGASMDMPEDLAFDRFQCAAFPDQPVGRPILGTPESVSGFDPTAISKYLKRQYHAASMVVSAAGDIEHEAFVDLVKQKFSDLPGGTLQPCEPARYKGGEWIEERDLQEAQILLGFEGLDYEHDDFFAAQLLASVLGGGMSSRLFQEVREKRGLCYSVYAFHWAFSDTGIFGVHAATGAEDIEKLMPVIINELYRIKEDLSTEELNRSKAQMRANLYMSLESPAARATQIARHIMLFGRLITPDEQIERLDAISVKDIKRVAERLFINTRPTLSAIGPVAKLITLEEVANQLSVPQAAE